METSVNNNNFISSKDDNDEERVMHSKSDNIEIINNAEAHGVIGELFRSLQNIYQNNLEELMKGREFAINYVHLLYCKCHKINLNCGESYVDSPAWIKSKKRNNKLCQ